MLTVCWSAKGGSGTTVVTCAMALLSAQHHDTTLLLDLAGDAPAALGLPDPSGPGVHDWVAASMSPPQSLGAIGVSVDEHLRLISAGTMVAPVDHPRWSMLGEHLADLDTEVWVDGGSAPPQGLLDAATQNLLVTRPCYLAVRRAAASRIRPSGVIVIREPGRALSADDVGAAVNAPVVAEITVDPAVARLVDAGLLLSRLPRSLSSGLGAVAA